MQASTEIPMALNKKILSMVGREEKDRPRSDNASMERKWYMGSCREGSVLMTNRMVVSQDSHEVHEADRDGDPNVHTLKPWDPNQQECGDCSF